MSNTILKLPIGDNAPDVVNAVVEIPRGSHNKYEFDEKLGVFKLDRVMYSQVRYPLEYAFIPETRAEDGDHMDAIIIGGDPVAMGCVVEMRPVGMLHMIDDDEKDFKVLGVQTQNPRLAHLNDIADVEAWNSHLLKEIVHFFETYKHLEGKHTKISGWGDAAEAKAEIKKAQEVYKKESH
jgi:inorganic pyrophosphatase